MLVVALRYTPLLLFVLIFLLFGLWSPRFLGYQSLENIIKQASYIGIVAVGMTFVLLTAGIDLSVGSNMFLSAVVAGLLIQRYGVPVPAALAACLAVGLLFGIVNALVITKLRIIPFVATLGTLWVGRGLSLWLTRSVAVEFPESVTRIGAQRLFGIVPLPVAVFLLVVLGGAVLLRWTALGRQLYAVGNDLDAAQKAGINTARVRGAAFVLCGFLAALGGFISVAQLGIVNAGFGEGREFDAIAAAVLGGTSLFGGIGSVFPGTLLGAVLIQMVTIGLVSAQVDLYIQPLVQAGIIFLAVLLDSLRTRQLARLSRRHIRVEEAAEGVGSVKGEV
jgi:ribose/xylose/arabinose/galactoside ABC-type transport system permease subunit